jgi:hypothetical protein
VPFGERFAVRSSQIVAAKPSRCSSTVRRISALMGPTVERIACAGFQPRIRSLVTERQPYRPPRSSDIEVDPAEAESARVVLLQGGIHPSGRGHHERSERSRDFT